jgi:hypothetical protein
MHQDDLGCHQEAQSHLLWDLGLSDFCRLVSVQEGLLDLGAFQVQGSEK